MTTTPFAPVTAFAGLSVDDIDRAAEFYRDTLDLRVAAAEVAGVAFLHLPGGAQVLLYAKPDHQPATYTALSFPVPDIEAAVAELAGRGGRVPALQGHRRGDRRAWDLPRRRPAHRVVHRPGRQRHRRPGGP